MKKTWEIVHDCDTEWGTPTSWVKEINSERYGKYVWISESNDGFEIEYDKGENDSSIIIVKTCKSLASAKRWVSVNIR